MDTGLYGYSIGAMLVARQYIIINVSIEIWERIISITADDKSYYSTPRRKHPMNSKRRMETMAAVS